MARYAITAIVAAVVAVFSASAVANVRTAVNRSKQKRTMADMRTIAQAWEENRGGPARSRDGWGMPFEMRLSADRLYIRSYGSDRKRDDVAVLGATTSLASDVIYEDGAFTAYPEGI
jgi:type II secretory pathway pseudopilin PulG